MIDDGVSTFVKTACFLLCRLGSSVLISLQTYGIYLDVNKRLVKGLEIELQFANILCHLYLYPIKHIGTVLAGSQKKKIEEKRGGGGYPNHVIQPTTMTSNPSQEIPSTLMQPG